MKTYYFTFGFGQKNEGYCQPVLAKSSKAARNRMVDLYGDKWAFQYTEDEFKQYRLDGTLTEVLLEIIRD